MTPDAYLVALVQEAVGAFGPDVVAVYGTGSLALGGFVPGRSDIDVIVVAADETPHAQVRAFAEAVGHPRLPCPAAGLELSVVRRTAAAARPLEAGYLLELNTGPELPSVSRVDSDRPLSWFAIDRAIARQSGTALFGPPPAEVLAVVTRTEALDAMRDSLAYQREQLGRWLTDTIVLNACRAWHFLETDTWASKPAAAAWAMARPGLDAPLVAMCLASHTHGGRAGAASIPLDRARGFVEALLTGVLDHAG